MEFSANSKKTSKSKGNLLEIASSEKYKLGIIYTDVTLGRNTQEDSKSCLSSGKDCDIEGSLEDSTASNIFEAHDLSRAEAGRIGKRNQV